MPGGLYGLKPRFQQSLRPIEDWLVARHVHPDRLTLLALALALGGGLAILLSPWQPALLLAVPWVAIVRTALNALDGQVARRLELTSRWGEVLNEVCDRLSDLALIGAVVLLPGIDLRLGAATLVAMLLASYIGIVGKATGGHRQYGGLVGKADRMVLLALAAPLALAFGGSLIFALLLVVILLGSLITCLQRMQAIQADLAHR